VLNIFVPQVGLQCARVVAPVRQCIAARVAQHVRMNAEFKFGFDTGPHDHFGEARRSERRARSDTNTNDDSSFSARSAGISSPCSGCGVAMPFLTRRTRRHALRPRLIPSQIDKLGGPEAMAIGHQDYGGVAVTPAIGSSRFDQPFDLSLGEVPACVQIGVLRPNCPI